MDSTDNEVIDGLAMQVIVCFGRIGAN